MDLSSLEGPPISDTRFTPQARYRQPDTYYPYIETPTNTDHRINDTNNDTNTRRCCPVRSHNRSEKSTAATLQPPFARPRARSNPCFSRSEDSVHAQDHIQHQDRERGRGRERGPPTRLIWLDNEQTWLMIDSRAVQSQSQSQSQPQSQHRHRYGQSLDLPPSYGNHLGDLMIAAQPGRPSSGHGGGYGYGGGGGAVQEHRRDGLSRWGAVARRVNGR